MSTISKINVGSKDYDIIDSGLRGLGTSIGSSDDLNNLVTPDTRFYFNGSGTAPTNSPTSSAYSLTVKSAPSGTSGCVIQTGTLAGAIYTRERTYGGGSYSWGAWKTTGADYSESVWGSGDGVISCRKVGRFVFMQVIKATSSSGYVSLGTVGSGFVPDDFVKTYAAVYSDTSIKGMCSLEISKEGYVSLSMVPSGGGNINASIVYVAATN